MPSKSSDPQRWLNDIRHNIHLARRFTEGVTYDAFRDDDLRFYAVTRCLEIISEASRRLPAELKARHPEIPWTDMAGAGNVYRHEYVRSASSESLSHPARGHRARAWLICPRDRRSRSRKSSHLSGICNRNLF
jgi:uncharacterized protein with HEPN domain